MNALTTKAGGSHSTAAATIAAVTIASLLALGTTISHLSRPDRAIRHSDTRNPHIPSPLRTQIPNLTPAQVAELPYPPEGALPGGRDVETTYGSIRVYEWGPETGEKVLFVHGISTPCVALGDLGWELVRSGYRVMLFDLFGRGYSDAPLGIPYDTRLYTSQILLVLASSHLSWLSSPPSPPGQISTPTDPPGFHLLGYSLGGCLCVSFAVQFPHLLRSLDLVASSGLIRRRHVGGASRFLYESGLLPEWFIHGLVRRRIRPADPAPASPLARAAAAAGAILKEKKKKSTSAEDDEASGADMLAAEASTPPPCALSNDLTTPGPQDHTPTAQPNGVGGGSGGNSDATGGAAFDSARLSRDRPDVTVSSVVRWQVDEHAGFIGAFMSTIRECPIYAQPNGGGEGEGEETDWAALRDILLLQQDGEDGEDGHVSTTTAANVGADADADVDAGTVMEKTSSCSSSNNTRDPKHDSATKTHAHHTLHQRGLSAKGKILVILGGQDTVIDRAEMVQDITAIFSSGGGTSAGRQLVDYVVFEDAGHEVPITSSAEVAGALVRHWHGE